MRNVYPFAAFIAALVRRFPRSAADVCLYVFALAHDADKELFYYGDRIKEPGVAIVSCNDGLRPVIMKLEATDEEARIEYTPIER